MTTDAFFLEYAYHRNHLHILESNPALLSAYCHTHAEHVINLRALLAAMQHSLEWISTWN